MGINYSTLNSAQREAVFSDYPRTLCLAGAGTGKTEVLTHRIARLWEAGVSPENILALTFTRAAGAEMKERVIGLIGADGKKLFCNTFHAFCVNVIRENAVALGYEPDFSVYDQTESDDLLTEVLAELQYKIPAKQVAQYRAGKAADMNSMSIKQAERAAKEYEFRLKRNNAFDFDGLIATVKLALFEISGIRENLRMRYRHVFVDEFQDTDAAQWEIVRRFHPENLFVVGDDFQSIYGFRGSDISIILGLADNPDWHTVKLEQNYRSTVPIINAANKLIKHNKQTEKKLITDKSGVAVVYREPEDDYAEIADIIYQLGNSQLKTTAIIARTNKQIDNAKSILKSRGVHCGTLSDDNNPMASNGAKYLLAWIAVFANPQDDVAMRKIASARMSKAAMHEVDRMQLYGSGSFIDALRETTAGVEFVAEFDAQRHDFQNSYDLLSGATRLNVRGMVSANCCQALQQIGMWQQRQFALGEPASAADLLDWVRSGSFADKSAKERDASKVWLMTVHGSKGLEFDEVYVIGAAQGTFPNRGDIEEERRLFYVAVTRAREYLNISRPQVMTDWYGNKRITERSQFVNEAINIKGEL